ncbi:Prefoldin subunit-domain-containing protein [Hypoxylon fuscum]|nr:Prefoldin subunit-domain-containing protein [Hypoxylon fuscum]
MAASRDSFVDLERHRQRLEENVNKLSKALDHWKQWKKEYGALHAEIKSLPPAASRHELTAVREMAQTELYNELLNEKELKDIFGPDDSKKAEQILSTLTNRLDYVAKNIDTLTKQVETAENKLAAVTVIVNPDATDEEGLPFVEITEELDDDDNVISYNLRRPGDNQPQIFEALQKAGMTDLPAAANNSSVSEPSQDADIDESGLLKDAPAPPVQLPKESQDGEPKLSKDVPSSPKKPKVSKAEETSKQEKPGARKKGVTFSEDTKPGEEEEKSETAKRLEEILQRAKDQQSIISDPIFPADESAEDRELREDMIRYNKETMEYEMAPIVAEINLEEGYVSGDSDDYSDYEEEDEDDEDEWGKSKIDVDDDWKLRMLELKERLAGHSFGPEEGSEDEKDMVEGVGRITIRHQGQDIAMSNGGVDAELATEPVSEDPLPEEKETKKSVRFAQSLDIAEVPERAPEAVPPKQPERPEVDPFSDVVERKGGVPQPAMNPTKKSGKVSRFRAQGRNNESPMNTNPVALGGTPILPAKPDGYGKEAHSGPKGKIISNSVLEHEPSSEAKEPDEFDADILQKQVTEEYHKMRNRLVHRQGGFMKENEDPIQPLDEEEGGPKRVSRFKAARLGQS